MISATKDTFSTEVLQAEGTVLVDFWASWCGPCKMLAPVLDELAAERPDVKVVKVNVDEEMALAQEYRVVSIPMLFVFQNGELKKKSVGFQPKEELLKLLD